MAIVGPVSSGSSVRPSAFVVTALSIVCLPSWFQSSMRICSAGLPRTRSRTWVLSFPDMVIALRNMREAVSQKIAQTRLGLDGVLQPQPGDLFDLAKGGGKFVAGRVVHPCRHRREDGRLGVEPGTDDEGKAELLLVGVVLRGEGGELGVGQLVEAGARLLTRGLGRKLLLLREAAGEVGVCANERELTVPCGLAHRRAQRRMQRLAARERPLRPRLLSHPRRVLEQMAERRGEDRAIGRVQFREGMHRNKAWAPKTKCSFSCIFCSSWPSLFLTPATRMLEATGIRRTPRSWTCA